MKIVLILCFCFILTLTKANDAVALGIIATMSLIPPRMTFPLDILQDDREEVATKVKVKNVTIENDASKLRRSYLECIEETHVRPQLVKKFKAGRWAENHPSLKQWALCVLVKMGMMSRQGVYRYDTAMAKIRQNDKNTVDKIIDRCLSKKSKPPQEIAWNYLRCHFKRDSKNTFPSLGIMYTL